MSTVDGAQSARADIMRWALSSPRRNRQDALRVMRDDALACLGTGTGGWSDRDIQHYADEINRHLCDRNQLVHAYRRRVLARIGPQLARDAAAQAEPAGDQAATEAGSRRCPECGEPAVRRAPSDLTPWQAHGQDQPEWSHADGSALCPVIGPDGYQPASPAHTTPASAPGLDHPATDAQFLDSCDQLASQLSDLAVQVTGWAEGLADMHVPRPVLAPLHDAARLLASAALQIIHASQAFRAQFGSARQAAARGLRITGDPS
jgi:hypothetical protein